MNRQAAFGMQMPSEDAPQPFEVCFCLSMGIGNKAGFVGLEFRFITILSKRHSINSLAQHLRLSPFVSFCLHYTTFVVLVNQLVVYFSLHHFAVSGMYTASVPLLLRVGRIFPTSKCRLLALELVLVAVASSFVENAVCTEFVFAHHTYAPSGSLSASDSSSTVSSLNVPWSVSKPMVYIYTTRLSRNTSAGVLLLLTICSICCFVAGYMTQRSSLRTSVQLQTRA